MKRLVLTFAILIGLAAPAWADLVSDLLTCVEITDNAKRLACYDQAVAGKQAKPGEQKIIVEYSGQGMHSTRPFSVRGPWEVQWAASGDFFSIILYTADGRMVDVVANQMGGGKGASFRPKGGNYYFAMNAMGSWTIRVVSLR